MKSELYFKEIFREYFVASTLEMWLCYLMGFKKKSQKTPSAEIEKALRIMKEYFAEQLKNKKK